MLSETQTLKYLFDKNFKNCRNKKIFFFGDEAAIKIIINEFPEFNFCGILQTNNIVNPNLIDILIVIIEPEKIDQCISEICDICMLDKILVYDISGNLLNERFYKRQLEYEFIEKFEKLFFSFRNKNIIIYGTGKKSRLLIENVKNFHLIGILDKDKTGYFYGLPILNYERALELKPDVIIVAAQEKNLNIIYGRIGDFCKRNFIRLFDLDGNDLFVKCKKEEDNIENEFDVDKNIVKKMIDMYDIVLFSFWDVLVMSKTLVKNDILEIFEEHAKKRNLYHSLFFNIRKLSKNIDSHEALFVFYDRIQKVTGISDSVKNDLLKLELEVIQSLCIERTDVVELLRYTYEKRKIICLVEDTQLPRDWIVKILCDLNIGGFNKLYLSNEFNQLIEEGLIQNVQNDYGNQSMLFLTSKKYEMKDVMFEKNVDILKFKSALELLGYSSYSQVRTMACNINDRSLIGNFIAKIFNSPFALPRSEKRPCVYEWLDLIYLFIAPLVVTYIIWLSEVCTNKKFDYILFASRDGWIFHKAYVFFKSQNPNLQLPPAKYFYTSRKAAGFAAASTERLIEKFFSFPHIGNPKEVLAKQFQFKESELKVCNKNMSLGEYALVNKKNISEKAKLQRDYYKYYTEKLGLDQVKKVGFFDLGTSGTTLFYLSRIMPFELTGVPLFWYDVEDEDRRSLDIWPMYVNNSLDDKGYGSYAKDSYLADNYAFLEPILTSLEPSVQGISYDGNPKLSIEKRNDAELNRVEKSLDTIQGYYEQYFKEMFISGKSISTDIAKMLFQFKDKKFTDVTCQELESYKNYDDLGQQTIKIKRT
ncbi:MAG: hypothetical protein KH366_01530 [Clostridiaceae bacterium]|nr:hypothetical protein [Clostridiaceae bacterium]